jgi:hypothetical protein
MKETHNNTDFKFQTFSENNKRNNYSNEIPKLKNSQLEEILQYRNYKFQNYLSKKCSEICIKKQNYQECLDNCMEKLINSNILFEKFLLNSSNGKNSKIFSI